LAETGRAEEIAEAVADHAVRRARQIWAALSENDGPSGDVSPNGSAGPSQTRLTESGAAQ
jgi:hypothetical protein